MPSINRLMPLVITLVAASLPYVNATCYKSGMDFRQLHGGNYDIDQEIQNDIYSTCSRAEGKVIKKNEPFWLCSNWAKTTSDKENCYDDCYTGCSGLGGGRAGELARVLCQANCDPHCDPGASGWNHIDWAIEARGGAADKKITKDACLAAFRTERGACSHGSEQTHDGLWFRIDPNEGKCPGT